MLEVAFEAVSTYLNAYVEESFEGHIYYGHPGKFRNLTSLPLIF